MDCLILPDGVELHILDDDVFLIKYTKRKLLSVCYVQISVVGYDAVKLEINRIKLEIESRKHWYKRFFG